VPVIIATSQTVAIYQGEVCLGGAQILARGASVFERQQIEAQQGEGAVVPEDVSQKEISL